MDVDALLNGLGHSRALAVALVATRRSSSRIDVMLIVRVRLACVLRVDIRLYVLGSMASTAVALT